jgi:uncharacterized membrane protein
MSVALDNPRSVVEQSVASTPRNISATAAVWAATSICAVGWAAVAVVRESRLLDARYNLGNFSQAIWSTAHGHFLQVTEVGGAEVSRLGIHVDPIIALFAPLWWLWPSPGLLVAVEAAALALGAVPLFWLARKHLPRERDAAFLAVAYLLCPTVAANAATAFSAVALAVPLLLFALWFLDEDRLWPFAATAGTALLCQEQIGLLVGCLGLWYAWRKQRIGAGLAIAALAFGVSAIDFFVVLRHFSGGSPYAARYGGSAAVIARDLFTHPLLLAHQISASDLAGLVLAVPVLALCFGSTVMLAAAPQVALLLLSRRASAWDWFGGNVLILVPFIYSGTAYTLGRAARKSTRHEPTFVAGQVLAASFVTALTLGPFGIFGVGTRLLPPQFAVGAQRQALQLIPARARVSATNHLALPLSSRRYVYVFPVVRNATWIVVDSRDFSLPNMAFIRHRSGIALDVNDLSRQPGLMRSALRKLRHNPKWHLVYAHEDIYVFRRRRTRRPSLPGPA